MAERRRKANALKKIRYEMLPPVGPGKFSKEGDLLSLLFDVPYFLTVKIVPPMAVVNEVLERGVVDAGMSGGCRWRRFQIDDREYQALVRELRKQRFKTMEPPSWVRSASDWNTWCREVAWGIPAVESKRLSDEIHSLAEEREAAGKSGDDEKAASLLMRINDLCMQWTHFVDKHRLPKPRIPLATRRPRRG